MIQYSIAMHAFKKFTTTERVFLLGFFLAVLTVTPFSVMDPMNLPKMTIVGILGITLLPALLNPQLHYRVREQKVLVWITGLFILNGAIVLFFSGRTVNEGLYGASGRNTGFLTYLGLSIVLYVAAQLSTGTFIESYINLFTVIGIILSIYGVIQHLGLEPFPYVNSYDNNVFGTFGNPNFQSAFMGIFAALMFSLILNEGYSLRRRMTLAVFTVVGVYGIFITNSWQGYFNFATGAGIAIVLNLFRHNKKKFGFVLIGIGSAIAVLVAMALFNHGPFASALAKASLSARRFYWEAALKMLLDNPLFGVGWDGFGDWFRRSRSVDAVNFNPSLFSNSAHSVPLDIASSGGIPLAVLYLSFIALGFLSVVKVVRAKKELSVTYIAVVAAWGAYQAQSLISINQIGLGVIGWSLTGLVIGYAHFSGLEKKRFMDRTFKSTNKISAPSVSFTSFFAPLVGLIVGCLVSLPPYVSASRFYEGLKTSDARVINVNAYLNPLDSGRMLYSASVLEKSEFFAEAHKIALAAVKNFPDSFEAWSFLLSLTNSTAADKARAESELERLDPSRKFL